MKNKIKRACTMINKMQLDALLSHDCLREPFMSYLHELLHAVTFFLACKDVPTLIYIYPYTSCEVYNGLRKN